MPWKPLSHSQRLRQSAQGREQRCAADQAYNARQRAQHGLDPLRLAKWRKLRTMKLARNLLCEDPEHRYRQSSTVIEIDHIPDVHTRPDLVFDLNNLQSLCKCCHARKSALERRGTRG